MLAAYAGIYRLDEGHSVGLQPFINDAGKAVLLFADHRTGDVRSLFPRSADDFAVVSGFDPGSPAERIAHFQLAASGRPEGVVFRSPDGAQAEARRVVGGEEEIVFRQADARLAGSLILPPGPGPHPAIVLLHGSGPLTRWSFGPYPRFFSSLGLAVLIFDKRGTGASTGRRLDASSGASKALLPAFYPDDLAADAAAALRFLQSRPEIDPKRIGFWGSSEGGMLTTQVAARTRDAAFAINSSGFMGPLWRTLLYQGAAQMRAAGAPEAEIEQAVAFNRSWMEVARTGRGYDAFVTRRQELLSSGRTGWLFYVSDEFSSLAQMRWAWRHILTFDPLPQVERVRCPALGVFGQKDRLTNVAEAPELMRKALARGGNRDGSTRVFVDAGHSLMDTSGPSRLAPGLFDTLRGWIGERVMRT